MRGKTRAGNMSVARRGKTGAPRKYETHECGRRDGKTGAAKKNESRECGRGAGERQAKPGNMSHISAGAARGKDRRSKEI